MKFISFIGFLVSLLLNLQAYAEFKAGAVALDVTPKQFPVLINGGMLSRSADSVADPIYARALVLTDGKTEIAIVVVDSCMMPNWTNHHCLLQQKTTLR